jgi:ureidoacrylate peracid hydrolase
MASASEPARDGTEPVDPFSAKQSGAGYPDVGPARTALLAVDIVNDYVDPAGAMPAAECAPVVEANRRLAEAARAAGVTIVWIRPSHVDGSDGLFRKRIPHAIAGSWGAEFPEGLGVAGGERVLGKRRYSAFFQTDLDLWLREHDVARVVVTGVALNICVRSTVHDAFFHGYEVWVARDACRATGEREEASTLYDIQTHFGEVMTVDEVIAAWS